MLSYSTAARDATPLFRITFRAMGGMNEIVVAADSPHHARQSMERAAAEVLRIERKYSRYRSDDESIVHRVNSGAGHADRVPCDPETSELLTLAGRLHALSGGLFDITSGVLRRAWDFSQSAPPPRQTIEPLLGLIGWERVEFNGRSIRLPLPGMEIDFGGFGKEYAADRAAAVLKSSGIVSGYVNLGGDIWALGGMPGGRPWRFGVRNPRDTDSMIASVDVFDCALVTSGDYEKFIYVDGVHYCHILHPRSGMPVNCWRSVSVTGVSALSAGAISTIAMLMEDDAVEFLESRKCRYLLVDRHGRLRSNQLQHAQEHEPWQEPAAETIPSL